MLGLCDRIFERIWMIFTFFCSSNNFNRSGALEGDRMMFEMPTKLRIHPSLLAMFSYNIHHACESFTDVAQSFYRRSTKLIPLLVFMLHSSLHLPLWNDAEATHKKSEKMQHKCSLPRHNDIQITRMAKKSNQKK